MFDPRQLLAKIDLTDAEIDVYLSMLGGSQTAREIIRQTDRSRPTVYYALTSLERRGLLSKTGLEESSTKYRVEPLERVTTMVNNKQQELDKARKDAEQFIRHFELQSKHGDHKPEVAFFEGVSAVRNAIMDSIYCHSRQIDSIVPHENFFWQLGNEFVENYVKTRQSLGVKTRNVWADVIKQEIIDEYYTQAEIRVMSKDLGTQFRTTIFIYDNSVLYISSLASGYALLVRSAEHVEFMSAIFKLIWSNSKPHQKK